MTKTEAQRDSPPPESKVPPSAREALERWARWRSGARYYGGATASGGQYLTGRGSRVCPTCKGSGRMPGHLVGSPLDFINVPCPRCEGARRIAGDLAADQRQREIDCVFCRDEKTGTSRGELPDGRTCHKCKGGKRLIIDLKVHPATIKGRRILGPDMGADPISARIEATVLEWEQHNATYWIAKVTVAEYCRNGTQTIKAKRMGVSQSWFSKNLKEAHARIEMVIRETIKKSHLTR